MSVLSDTILVDLQAKIEQQVVLLTEIRDLLQGKRTPSPQEKLGDWWKSTPSTGRP